MACSSAMGFWKSLFGLSKARPKKTILAQQRPRRPFARQCASWPVFICLVLADIRSKCWRRGVEILTISVTNVQSFKIRLDAGKARNHLAERAAVGGVVCSALNGRTDRRRLAFHFLLAVRFVHCTEIRTSRCCENPRTLRSSSKESM